MHIYVDTLSHLYAPPIWEDAATYEPRKPTRRAEQHSTAFVAEKDALVDYFALPEGPLAPTMVALPHGVASPLTTPTSTSRESADVGHPPATNQAGGSEIQRIAKQRVQLMAAAYARGSESSEILARLEILNHRLLNRSPRISKEQVSALESANEQLVEIRAAREQQARRLGISI